jgi:hypothetical protein
MIVDGAILKDAMLAKRRSLRAHSAGLAPLVMPASPAGITPADDGYHFGQYQNSSHRFWYVEWWYFNFVVPPNQLAGMITFAIANPGDVDGLAMASLNLAMFDPAQGTVTTVMDYFPGSAFTASSQQADVIIDTSAIRVQPDGTYDIAAAPRPGDVTVDLTYRQADQPVLLANNVQGYDPWEISSWLVDMPSATVDGCVTIAGTQYQLQNANGYHDHDWGMWLLPDRVWSWAQFSSPAQQISLDIGFHAAFQQSSAYFRHGALRLMFPQQNFNFIQDGWQDWEFGKKYPTQMTFGAVDATGAYQLELAWQVTSTAVLWKYPLIVFEQTAHYQGSLNQLDTVTGQWKPILPIDEMGFAEYTDTWL